MNDGSGSGSPRARAMDRRAFLAGAGGLAVGAAGGGAAGAMLNGSANSAGPHVASPGEELMVEHGLLKRLVLAYRALHGRLTTGGQVPKEAIIDAAQIISDYVEGFHEGLEEAYVFPRVAAQNADLVRTLLIQHDCGRHLTAAIQDAAADDVNKPAVRTVLATSMAAFVRMYEPHEAWEDTVIYPALRRATPQRTLDLLAERFADLEAAQYGHHALGALLDRIAGIEEQLGIHDLASFTPKGVA